MGFYSTVKINELPRMKRHGRNKCLWPRDRSQYEKSYIPFDFNCMTFWKKENFGDNKRINGFQGLGCGRKESAEKRGKYLTNASQVAQWSRICLQMQETQVWPLGQFDPWVRKIAWRRKWQPSNPLQYPCLGSPMDRGAWELQSMGFQKSRTWLRD